LSDFFFLSSGGGFGTRYIRLVGCSLVRLFFGESLRSGPLAAEDGNWEENVCTFPSRPGITLSLFRCCLVFSLSGWFGGKSQG